MAISKYRRKPKKDVDKIVEAIEKQTREAGKWSYIQIQVIAEGLAAIALACATPGDNSATIEAEIVKLRTSRDKLKAALDENDPD